MESTMQNVSRSPFQRPIVSAGDAAAMWHAASLNSSSSVVLERRRRSSSSSHLPPTEQLAEREPHIAAKSGAMSPSVLHFIADESTNDVQNDAAGDIWTPGARPSMDAVALRYRQHALELRAILDSEQEENAKSDNDPEDNHPEVNDDELDFLIAKQFTMLAVQVHEHRELESSSWSRRRKRQYDQGEPTKRPKGPPVTQIPL